MWVFSINNIQICMVGLLQLSKQYLPIGTLLRGKIEGESIKKTKRTREREKNCN